MDKNLIPYIHLIWNNHPFQWNFWMIFLYILSHEHQKFLLQEDYTLTTILFCNNISRVWFIMLDFLKSLAIYLSKRVRARNPPTPKLAKRITPKKLPKKKQPLIWHQTTRGQPVFPITLRTGAICACPCQFTNARMVEKSQLRSQ